MAEIKVPPRKLWKVLKEAGIEPWWRLPLDRPTVTVTPQKIEAIIEQKLLRERGIRQFYGFKDGYPLLGMNSIAHLVGVSLWWLRMQPDLPKERKTLSEWLKVLPPILERHRKGHQGVIELEKIKAEVILRASEIFKNLITISRDGDATERDASTSKSVFDSSVSV